MRVVSSATTGFEIMFNPRNGDYDPTADLDLLGVAYEVLVVEGKSGGRFEARFRPSTAS